MKQALNVGADGYATKGIGIEFPGGPKDAKFNKEGQDSALMVFCAVKVFQQDANLVITPSSSGAVSSGPAKRLIT